VFGYDEYRKGLWSWFAEHPDWRPGAEPESPADWPRAVRSVAHRANGELLVVDPLIPAGSEDEFWPWFEKVRGMRGVVAVTTIKFHRRSRDEFVARYRATTSRAKRNLPGGVRPLPIRGAGETMFWIEEHRALVPGDRIIDDGLGGLRMCPESWLSYLESRITVDHLRELLRPLLELPIELVLVSHGEPVSENGREALRTALDR
jgi:hypothetical protein